MDKKWIIRQKGYDREAITTNGNRFFCGNGYLGIRGTLEEYEKEQLPAINLSGIYDQVGDGWREPLNAPNGLFTRIKIDGVYYTLPEEEPRAHEQRLDYRYGLVQRITRWKTKRGEVTVISEHFAHITYSHLICMRYRIKADFHADVEVVTGIDADVWDIHGPHYDEEELREENGYLYATMKTHEKKDTVAVVEGCKANFPYELKLKKEPHKIMHRICLVTRVDEEIDIEKTMAVFTSADTKRPVEAAQAVVEAAMVQGYHSCKKAHKEGWEKLWNNAEIEIEGDPTAMESLNYSIYHLKSIAPRHAQSMSIAARGLSGQTYKGAVFWDTEMFMLDLFLYTEPNTAKTLLKYRVDTLDGARKKAAAYGYQGAFYAWESQEGGYDACSDYNVTDVFTGRPMRTFFKDKQIHISAAIVHGIMRYTEVTGDNSLLEEGGIETILACAQFYESMLVKRVYGNDYELRDVIGPDEYHERVNNNGYTNRMAQYTFTCACNLLEQLDTYTPETRKRIADLYEVETLQQQYREDAKKIYIPQPDTKGIIPQFDGYELLEDVSVDTVRNRLLHEKEYWGGAYGVASQTKVIKQADVVTWLTMFPEDTSDEIKKKNWAYYEPRTEHGSSLSACMYALLACKCQMPDKAYPFFLKSAQADLLGGGKEWAGLVYIGGTHPAAAGGAYMTAVNGFGGLYIENGKLKVKPQLPSKWKKLRFRIWYKNQCYEITETQDSARIEKLYGTHAFSFD